MDTLKRIIGFLRIGVGWIFLWAFLDKVFGLGFATKLESAWLGGTSPTAGFLKFATKGPFAEFYQGLAGNPLVDWLFMLGLLFVGIAMLSGIMVRLGSYAGALMMFLMWTAAFPPVNNPFLDEHIIYLLLFLFFAASKAGHYMGFGARWEKVPFVRRNPILE